jgi:hypothetical protein
MADRDHPKREALSSFLVRCWSDADDAVLVKVKSFSVYQAADDARHEHPGFQYYDPVRALQADSEPQRPSEPTEPRTATS